MSSVKSEVSMPGHFLHLQNWTLFGEQLWISSMDNCLDCSQVYSHPLTMSYATPLANCDSCPVSLQVNLMLSECDPWHL